MEIYASQRHVTCAEGEVKKKKNNAVVEITSTEHCIIDDP